MNLKIIPLLKIMNCLSKKQTWVVVFEWKALFNFLPCSDYNILQNKIIYKALILAEEAEKIAQIWSHGENFSANTIRGFLLLLYI